MSESTVIKIENLSKQYRLGVIGTGTLSHDLNRLVAKLRGKPDPYLKFKDPNEIAIKGNHDYVWALKNVDIELKQGEILGIIGKNGAGKSTLLKILSRVTTPSKGSIKIKGRTASLLEVGTGFHPELTGRENIFLNGAILGMSKREIKSKLEEIVDFSGIEQYIDTPVKRYSTGMYVRLAFAVAAHLEPDILIVDEVLAVGDSEFQKKCLGKMKDVSRLEGRTVLFVSHQLGTISSLCSRCILMENGEIAFNGSPTEAIDFYLKGTNSVATEANATFKENLDLPAQILKASMSNQKGSQTLNYDVFDKISIDFEFVIRQKIADVNVHFTLLKNGEVFACSSDTDRNPERLEERLPGHYSGSVQLPSPLKSGNYTIHLNMAKTNASSFDIHRYLFEFFIEDLSFDPSYKSYAAKIAGMIVADLDWKINKVDS